MELIIGKTSQNFNSKNIHLCGITVGREEYFVTTCINKIFINKVDNKVFRKSSPSKLLVIFLWHKSNLQSF